MKHLKHLFLLLLLCTSVLATNNKQFVGVAPFFTSTGDFTDAMTLAPKVAGEAVCFDILNHPVPASATNNVGWCVDFAGGAWGYPAYWQYAGSAPNAFPVCNLTTGVCTAQLAAKFNAGAQLTTSGGQPSCDSGNRGMLWNIEGAAGVADVLQVCQKSVLDTYVWVTK